MVSVLQYCVCLFLFCQQRVLSQGGKREKEELVYVDPTGELECWDWDGKENELQSGSWWCWLGVPLLFPAPHAVLIMLVEIPAFFFLGLAAQNLSKFPWKMSFFCIFQITSFAQGTLWCLQKIFGGRGKGDKFPCFWCGKWKICKLIEGKKSGKSLKPKGKWFFLPVSSSSVFMAVCGHSRKEIVPANGIFMAPGQLLPPILAGCE